MTPSDCRMFYKRMRPENDLRQMRIYIYGVCCGLACAAVGLLAWGIWR